MSASTDVPCARGRALATGLCLALAVSVLWPLAAHAEFSTATLVSGNQQLQFDEANAPALAADGDFAVFQGTLADVPGVYRRDLRTGEVTLVAGGDAAAPSVSADGRYVAFTTVADLEPEQQPGGPGEPAGDQGCPEVYVRDMEATPGQPEYTLASALAGEGQGIEFAGGCPASEGSSFAIAGAQAAPGVALSADGRHVVFTVLSRSNLAGSGTEASQVVVRDLDTETTTLVTATPQGLPTPHGGAFPSTDSETHTSPVRTSDPSSEKYGDQVTASTAAISADASTVAWLGTNLPAQVPSSAGELEAGTTRTPLGREPLSSEAEPLWRRVADGPAAVTRRLLVGAGLDFFYPAAPVESTDPVLSGSMIGEPESVFVAPALSADGRTVAVLASAPRPALEASFPQSGLSQLRTDAYVVNVEDDLAVAPGVTALTEIADYAAAPAAVEYVKDLAISPDGTRVAFDTARTQFDLPSLALISPPIGFTRIFETYEANLPLGTLQRVSSTYDGSEANGNMGLLSFSGDGQTLAFASLATNLFFGDGVPTSQVYLARELSANAALTPQQIGASPAYVLPAPRWLLDASASAAADGSVLVQAQVPGAGRLTVSAGAQLPAAAKGSSAKREGNAAGASAAKAKGGKRKQTRSGTAIPARTVATGTLTARASSELRLRLRLRAPYRTLLASGNGLYAVLRVTFAAPHEKTLVEQLPVTFRRIVHGARARKRKTRAREKSNQPGKSGIAR